MLEKSMRMRLVGRWVELSVGVACALLGDDRRVVEMARRVGLFGKARARMNLDHYLTGGGVDLVVDTAALLDEDERVRGFVLGEICEEMGSGKSGGAVRVGQEVYGNQDWRYALGGIEMSWEVVGGDVELKIVGGYEWHEGEGRVTKGLHVAAGRLEGAGAYRYDGKVVRIEKGEVESFVGGGGKFVSVNLL